MKNIFNAILLLFTSYCFSQQILNSKETISRTVSDPRAVILLPGFSAKSTEVNPFHAKIGESSETPVSGGTTSSTVGATNASGEIASTGTMSSFHDTKGNIDVNNTGQLQFNFPIALPPGVKSVAPQINLVYTSGTGNGIAGMGFSLSGITSINRMVKDIERDGESKGLQLDYSDFYEFNGQRLLLKSGTYGKDGAEYVTEKYSTLKIKSIGAISANGYSGPASFEVTFDNGAKAWYGVASNATTPINYNIVKWKDAQGNYITYNYAKNNNVSVVTSIDWGGNETLGKSHFNSIIFNYTTRNLSEVSYVGNLKFLQANLLSNIVVNANGNQFKKYIIEYTSDSNITGYQYVSKITEYNSQNQAANPVTFGYQTSSDSGWNSKSFVDNQNNKIVGDFDGDGKIDYLKYADPVNGYSQCVAWEEVPSDTEDGTTIRCAKYEIVNGLPSGIKIYKSFLDDKIDSYLKADLSQFTKEEFNKAIPVNLKKANGELSAKQGILITKKGESNTLFKVYSITNQQLQLEFTKTIANAELYKTGSSRICYGLSGYCTDTEKFSVMLDHKVLDLDGDGVSELIITIKDEVKQTVYVPNSGSQSTKYDDFRYFTVNLDPSLVDNKNYLEIFLGVSNNIFNSGYVGDFKGDGKIALLTYDSGTRPILYSFKKDKITNQYTAQTNYYDILVKGLRDRALVGDFNGDKKSDLLVPVAENSSDWYLYTATGNGFKEEYKSNLTYYRPFEEHNYTSNWHIDYYEARKINYQALDLDKDGKSELIAFNYYTKEHTQSGYEHRDFSNTTISIYRNAGANATTDVNFYNSDNHNFDFALFDFNELVGDYQVNKMNSSILLFGSHRKDRNQGILFSFDLYNVSQNSRIYTISQGNVPTIIFYNELKKDGIFYDTQKQEKYPYIELENVSNTFVVSQLYQLGRKQDFKYRGLLAHVNGRGIIGFRTTARSNWYANGFENTKVWTAAQIDPLLNSVVSKEWTTRTNDNVFPTDVSLTNNQLLSVKLFNYKPKEVLSNGVEVILPDSSTEKDFLKNITTTSNITYGDFYLPTSVVTSINGSFTTTTDTAYSHNETGTGKDYYIGRIKEKKVTATAYGDTKVAKSTYTYLNNLPETIKTYNQDESEYLLETYTNDGFGNTIAKTVSNSTDAQTQSTSVEYDNKGRFAVKNTNNLGLITMFTYNDWGQVLTQTDPLNNTITNTYDSWGKPLTANNNLSGTTTYTYKRDGDDIVTTVYSPAGDSKQTRLNRKGEPYLVTTKGFDKDTYIAKKVEYDAVGRKIKESDPYFITDNPKWNTITYDDTTFPAKVSVTGTDGKIVESQVIDKTTTTTELNGYNRVTKKTTDALGNLIESEDKGGTIKFTYNALGQNISANYGQNKVTTKYDSWGRKKEFNDPANGTYQYEYDSLGNLKKEISPKGTKEYVYNTLGQLVTQKELSTNDGGVATNKTITFTYNSKGLIIGKTGTANGKPYDSYVVYDSNGRITSTGENSNSRFFFKKNIAYDDTGRVTSYEKGVYSTGGVTKTTIENTYTAWSGELYQVKDKNTATVLWELQKAKANGQILNAKLGAVSIDNKYDNNNFLTTISHTSAIEPNVLKIAYSFNALKNELNTRTRTDGFSISEVFNYDDNNRLLSWTNPKTNQLSSNGYDDKGRILENDQVGKISFSTTNLYQANSMELNAAGEKNYKDNIKQLITYNENNDPILIDGEKGNVLFTYGLTQMRQMATYGGNFDPTKQGLFTKYYSEDGSTEIIVNNTTGQEKHLLYIGGSPYDSNIIYAKEYGTTQTKYLFLHKDYLGSILAITDQAGNKLEQRHFDAWGVLTHGEMKLLDRGYTSHEHFDQVGIIHMNGRLYDPLLRRFLNADQNIQDPNNTQNYNKYGYVLNNPLMFNDPSGESYAVVGILVAAAIAATIAVASYAVGLIINNRLDQFNSGQALKTAFWGAIAGAASYGIGSIFTASSVANALGNATFIVQAAAHGISQGIITMAQNDGYGFWQGAAAGFFGSLGATAWSAVAPNFSQSAVGTIAFGAVSGGVAAELSGGNFWEGAITGAIVSGLNHVAHMGERALAKHKFDKEIDAAYGSKADSAAPATETTLNNMREDVPTLKNWYNKSGKPRMYAQANSSYASDGSSEAMTFTYDTDNYKSSTMTFFRSSFASYRTLAHNMLHELGHAYFNYTGQLAPLISKYGQYSNKPQAFSEVYAFKFAFQYGGVPYLNNAWYLINNARIK